MVDSQLTQVSVVPVFTQVADLRRQVGYVGIFVVQVTDDIKDVAERQGFETMWLLPGGVRLGSAGRTPDDNVFRDAPDLATQLLPTSNNATRR